MKNFILLNLSVDMLLEKDYCRSGDFRVFKLSQISDLEFFTKFRIREFSIFFSSAIIIIFMNSRICLRENYNPANITRSTV